MNWRINEYPAVDILRIKPSKKLLILDVNGILAEIVSLQGTLKGNKKFLFNAFELKIKISASNWPAFYQLYKDPLAMNF